MIAIALEGFLLGLSTGLFCLGSCAPALVPYVLTEERRSLGANLRLVGRFLLGRFVAYAFLGLAVGYLGMQVRDVLPGWAIGLSLVGLSVLVIGYAGAQLYGGGVRYPPALSLCRLVKRHSARLPFVLGFLVGIGPCPPFLLAIARAFERGDPLSGVLLFLAFFLATSLYMLPVVFVGLLSGFEQMREVARLAAIIVGGLFLLMGIQYWL